MFKRSLYVVISSIIAATAVGAWSHQTFPQEPQEDELPNIPKKNEPNRDILNYHNGILTALQADDTIVTSSLQTLATHDALRAPLTRKEKDEFKQVTLENAFKALMNDPTLKDAQIRALVDLQNQTVIASNDHETTTALIQRIQTSDAPIPTSGLKHELNAEQHARIAWHCIDENPNYCMLTLAPITVSLPQHMKCQAANQVFVTCPQGQVDTQRLFDAQDCAITTDRAAIFNSIQDQNSQTGTFHAHDKDYEFKRSSTNSGYTIATVVILPPPDAAIDTPKTQTFSLSKYKDFGIAAGAFAIMLALGWFCVRRREDTTPHKALPNQDILNALKEECAKTKTEKANLKKQVDQLEAEKESHTSKIKQLEDQLDYAKKAYQKEQLTRMTLEQEKQRLDDALASIKISQHTAIENISHFADHNSSLTDLKRAAKEADNQEGNFNRITAPAAPQQLEALASEKSQSFFDALSDETWDDIADSFDAIFSASKADIELVPKTSDHISTSILPEDPDDPITKDQDALSAEDLLKAERQSVSKEPSPAKSISSINAVKNSGSINAVLSSLQNNVDKTSTERQVMPSAHDLAVKKSATTSTESFKPAPSWTGKKVTDTGMDQNSLYDALKRRARDVSEITPSSPNIAKSGVFDFNIGLSKSGVFSVTGSRVDIDPLSDTEYFKSLYEKYIETQKQCGESTNKFTLEQFVSRLAREKERLIETHNCRNVRFTVYIKEGKASLKATPQK